MKIRTRGVLAILAIGSGLLPAVAPRVVRAIVPAYERGPHDNVQGVNFRTRGYYPVQACLEADVACVTATTGRFRPEATAQAKTIQELSRSVGQVYKTIPDDVQWEVAPGPDNVYAPDASNPNEPPTDPPDPAWRADIMMNDSTLLEVRRWSPSAPTDVDRRLIAPGFGYVPRALTLGVTLARDDSLNTRAWSRAFLDDTKPIPVVWCVWADTDRVAHAGNIYFAPRGKPRTTCVSARRAATMTILCQNP